MSGLISTLHYPDTGRACVHALEVPPTLLVLSKAVIERLNFQPRVCKDPACIASRNGNMLTLEFDDIGPWFAGSRSHRRPVGTAWRYLYQLCGRDELTVLATRVGTP